MTQVSRLSLVISTFETINYIISTNVRVLKPVPLFFLKSKCILSNLIFPIVLRHSRPRNGNSLTSYSCRHLKQMSTNLPFRSQPVCIWCQNDVVSTSMRRDDVASTLIRRHFTSCACWTHLLSTGMHLFVNYTVISQTYCGTFNTCFFICGSMQHAKLSMHWSVIHYHVTFEWPSDFWVVLRIVY